MIRPFSIVYLLSTLVIFASIFYACKEESKTNKELSGKELSVKHCSSCHLLPNPNELDKKTWKNNILPRMGFLLGLKDSTTTNLVAFDDYPEGVIKRKSSPYFVHNSPAMSSDDWMKIKEYYLTLAPEKLKIDSFYNNSPITKIFKPKAVSLGLRNVSTTMVSFLAPKKLMAADYFTGQIFQFNEKIEVTKFDSIGMGAVQFQETHDSFWSTLVGPIFVGTDSPQGVMARYPKDNRKPLELPITGLRRPVHASFADLDNDRLEDILICEFGKWSGSLSWWKFDGSTYHKNELLPLPGATLTEVLDFDGDGDLDIIALMAQAREAVYLFTNNGKGGFESRILIEFPATYGSTYIKLIDYNNDGLLDILHVSGDNGDYVPVVDKPYQGVRIFINQRNNEFSEDLFIPVPGAYRAAVVDVDLDGDKDIAVISFFPTKNQPSFLLFENQGNDHFVTSTIDQSIKGRWISMDHLDFDEDGDEDFVLGSFDWSQKNIKSSSGVTLVYLENTSKKSN